MHFLCIFDYASTDSQLVIYFAGHYQPSFEKLIVSFLRL